MSFIERITRLVEQKLREASPTPPRGGGIAPANSPVSTLEGNVTAALNPPNTRKS